MATGKIQYRDLSPNLINQISTGLGYDDTELRGIIKYLRDQFDKWLQKPAVEIMNGATANVDGSQGMAPTPKKGQQNHVLTGGAKWIDQKSIKAGRAVADKNGNPIVGYLNNARFDKGTKTLVFSKGDGTYVEVPLVKEG